MRFRFFAIPALDPAEAEAELNRCCAAERVVGVERELVQAGADSYWAVCLSLAEGPGPLPAALKARHGTGSAKVDYREVLNEADFAAYSRLRSLRKALAERDGVPPYAVFTNEQMASMVQRRVADAQALSEIVGIGRARIERYGEMFLAELRAILYRPDVAP